MRIVLYITLLLFVLSCTHDRSKTSLKEMDATIEAFEAELPAVNNFEEIDYQNLTTQKLQDLYDLLVLQKQYPEFNDAIALQLKKFSEDRFSIPDSVIAISIENIERAGELQNVSDSIKKLKLRFNIVAGNTALPDSITAIISRKIIRIDNKKTMATTVTFLKE